MKTIGSTRIGILHFCLLLSLALASAAIGAEPDPAQNGKPERLQLDLESAIRLGSAQNFNLRTVKDRARSVDSIERESWMAYLPAASVSLERTRAIVTGDSDSRATEVRLNLEQVIYDGGQRDLDLGLARLEKALLGYEYQRDANQLRVEIQNAFLTALAARGKVDLNRRSLVRAREQMRLARLEEKAGFTTRPEVFLVAARMRQIELSLRRAENAYVQALYQLKLTMNLDPEVELDPQGDIFRDFVYDPPDVDLEELVRNAKKVHPEILRSHANVFRRKKEKEIADRTWIPRLSMAGYVGRAGEKFPINNETWGVNFAVTFPLSSSTATSAGSLDVAGNGVSRTGSNVSELNLFDNPSLSRVNHEARVAYSQAIWEHRQLTNRVAIDVRRRYQELEEAWESIRLGNGRVYFQMASLKVASKQFEVGQTRRAEILLNEVDLVQAQEDLTDDLASYLISAYALELSAAIDPGSLELYEYDPGAGNTLLAHMLQDDFKSIKDIRPPPPREKDGEYFEEFEIDKIKIDESTRRDTRPAPRVRERVQIVPRQTLEKSVAAVSPAAAEAPPEPVGQAQAQSLPPPVFIVPKESGGKPKLTLSDIATVDDIVPLDRIRDPMETTPAESVKEEFELSTLRARDEPAGVMSVHSDQDPIDTAKVSIIPRSGK